MARTQVTLAQQKFRVTSTTSTATPAPDCSVTDMYVLTAQAAAAAFTNPAGTPTDGQELMVRVKATGAFAVTYGTLYLSSGVATLPTTTVSGKTISFKLVYDATAVKWVCMAIDATGY